MKFPRRQFLHLAAGAAALPALSRVARAQVYPTRPVRIVVGFPAGGAPDIIARLIAQGLSEQLGQQFFVENRPGAGTNIATEAIVRAPPDGYTLLQFGPSSAINATLYKKLNFNFTHDIASVASIVSHPNGHAGQPIPLPAKTVPRIHRLRQGQSGQGQYGIDGSWIQFSHMTGEMFKMMADIELVHVPYRGGTAVGGRLDRRTSAGPVLGRRNESNTSGPASYARSPSPQRRVWAFATGYPDGRRIPARF